MNKIIFNILKKNNIDIAEDLYHYGWSIFVHYLFYLNQLDYLYNRINCIGQFLGHCLHFQGLFLPVYWSIRNTLCFLVF